MNETLTYTAFEGDRRIASGSLRDVLPAVKKLHDSARDDSPSGGELVLIFEDEGGRQVDFDLRGTLDEVLDREAPVRERRGRGRPRLGVIGREVTLLPRHWAWLDAQRSGASAALRQLVDAARRNEGREDVARRATDAAGRFITAMAGNRPNFEEAYRALYAHDERSFAELVGPWPEDVREHALRLAAGAFPPRASAEDENER